MGQIETLRRTSTPIVMETILEDGRNIHMYPIKPPLVSLDLPPLKPPVLSPVDTEIRQEVHRVESKEKEEPQTLEEHIAYFDANWRSLNLPENWYTVSQKMGFSIKGQMALLTDMSKEGRKLWSTRTRRDLLGFYLEYLDTDHVVYPVTYEIETDENGERRMVDKRYKKSPSEMTLATERNGEVKGAIEEAERFFLAEEVDGEGNLKDGQIGVMGSSRGPSGLTTDDGKNITYPDSYVFMWQRKGNVINGVTIQTDFSLQECREFVDVMKGETSRVETSGSEYVNMLALLDSPEHRASSLIDMVQLLKKVRQNNFYRSSFAFENKTWEKVIADVQKGEALYDFNLTVEGYQNELEAYCMRDDVDETDINKALAATLLRAGKHFLIDGKQEASPQLKKAKRSSSSQSRVSGGGGYSGVVGAMESARGCNGGGKGSVSVMSGGANREGTTEGDTTDKKDESVIRPIRIAESGGVKHDYMSISEMRRIYPNDTKDTRFVECPKCERFSIRPYEALIEKCLFDDCGKSLSCGTSEYFD